MDTVDFKHSIKNHLAEHDTFQKVVDIITKIPSVEKLKLDPELTLYVCKCLENVIEKINKIDKKNLAVRVLTAIFSLSNDEQLVVGQQIEFLYNNGKINKSSIVKVVKKTVGNWITKKLL
jgi:hypothetical protein